MKCPCCGYQESKVVDSRSAQDGATIRRRRECLSCKKRFTTFEMIESVPVFVVKKNGARELFDRAKLLAGIMKATEKRPVNAEQIALEIEAEIQNAQQTIPLVEADSRLGWEPSMEYIGSVYHLNWKIRQVRQVLDTEIPRLNWDIQYIMDKDGE